MKNVTYISAGAGSGKTHTLTHTLADLIEGTKEGFSKASADKAILTTFTVKAASEIKEKAKAVLYEKGLNEEASMLDLAMMGTIHSIAYSFINKYWFHLGLCPNMNVLMEEDVDFYVSQSLAELPTEDELLQLRAFRDAFDFTTPFVPNQPFLPDYDYWKRELTEIIRLTTNYGMTDYSKSIEESSAFYRQFVKPGTSFDMSRDYLRSLVEIEAGQVETHRESNTKAERQRKLRYLRRNVDRANIQWLKTFASIPLKSDEKKEPLIADFMERYSDVWQSENTCNEVESHIRLVFSMAERWRENYAQYKRKRKLLDYDDMEKYMYSLLQMPEVCEDITRCYDYLFVDEFQDCSPIQVKIFDKLSELVKHSWWVGDFKQAIYGFRGSDTELTKAVVDRIETMSDGCSCETLDTSHRSLPDIVDLTNRTFSKTFRDVLPEDRIVLKEHRKNENGVRSLRVLQSGMTSGDLGAAIPLYVKNLICSGEQPKDIAILARTNGELDFIDGQLKSEDIPTSRQGEGIYDEAVTALVESLLMIVLNSHDNLAKATVALLTEPGFDTGRIIDEKLLFDAADDKDGRSFLDDVPMVKKVLDIRSSLRQQSVGAMVESLLIELDLYDFMRSMEGYKQSVLILHTIDETAKQYEEHSIQMNLPATINGFIDYLRIINPSCPGDENGVQLVTCHGSKGLEWKHVILTSLDTNPVEEKKFVRHEFFGVHAMHESDPDKDNLFPDVSIELHPWIYGSKGNAKAPEAIRMKIVGSDLFEKRRAKTLEEANRLFYVSVTRASDILTLAVTESENAFQLPVSLGLTEAGSSAPKGDWWDCLGVGKPFLFVGSDEDREDMGEAADGDEFGSDYFRYALPFAGAPCQSPLRYQQPSSTSGTSYATLLVDTRKRIELGKMDGFTMADVGTCIHNIFCTIDSDVCDIDAYVQGCGMSKVLPNTGQIRLAWDTLAAYLEDTFGPSVGRDHELQFTYSDNGQIFTGSMDLVWRTEKGCVLVDYKTCPKGKEAILDDKNVHYAGNYGGQFGCYEKALKAHREVVLEKIVYYPVSGLIIRLDDSKQTQDNNNN